VYGLASIRLLLRRSRSWTILGVGLLLICLGVIAGFRSHPYWSGILLSTGSSITAAVLVWLLSPTNEEAYEKFLSFGIREVHQSRDHVKSAQWVRWLRSATRSCVLVGTSHSKWCTDAEFKDALTGRLRNDVDVKIFFLDPSSHAAELRAKEEELGRDTLVTIKSSIRVLWKIRTELPPDLQLRLKLYTYRATPSMGVTWIDDRLMVVSHILAGSMNVTSPCMLLEPARYGAEHQGLYETYARNVRSIEDNFSSPITEANVHTVSSAVQETKQEA
jgi:hypothetical protein